MDPLTFRRQFDHGAGPEPLQRASAAYGQFAQQIQYMADRTQAIVRQLEWESIAAEQAQQAAAAFYLSMQEYAQTAQTAAVVAQSGASTYTQAGQGQMTEQILILIVLAAAFYLAWNNWPEATRMYALFAIGGFMAYEAIQLLFNSQQQASSLAPAAPVSSLASPAPSPASSGGDSSDLSQSLSQMAAILPLLAAANQNKQNNQPPPPPGPPTDSPQQPPDNNQNTADNNDQTGGNSIGDPPPGQQFNGVAFAPTPGAATPTVEGNRVVTPGAPGMGSNTPPNSRTARKDKDGKDETTDATYAPPLPSFADLDPGISIKQPGEVLNA